ncbi:hypothetical protein B0H11DRAFT_2067935 [Mycena galericulata]|nr:hypothetical protein B0H11DRAFT_2067935 [Mycena galericulata]
MALTPRDEAETLPVRSPSPSASVEDKSDLGRKDESPSSPRLTDDSLMPPAEDDSTSSAASSAGSASRSPTPPPLATHLPVAREDALTTFTELPGNNYQFKNIGRSREGTEGNTCECTYKRGQDPVIACGQGSTCINRLTQIECLPDDCRCRRYCQNQRFQRKQYADIQIVLTEKKGFGLRAESELPKDTFIYEYVGDIINHTSFKKRMRDYADEGIRHFYFMALQKNEVPAVLDGFANHSCNPNCYVAKWTIGEHVRMGIFAKRKIEKYEELTFNYNVDRYGHQPQKCYCGELQCVGFIGGKTQTDLVTVDDLYLNALGIEDEAEVMELKGTKKKKGKKLDDPDFLPELRPIKDHEVPTIMQAVRQTESREMLVKLLTRFRLTTDGVSQREMMRLRCFSLMKNVLEDYASDPEIVGLVLESIRVWPLTVRNKVEDSNIEPTVKAIAESEDEKLKPLAQGLLDHWATLTLAYKIPKRVITKEEEDEEDDKPAYVNWERQYPARTPPQYPITEIEYKPRPTHNHPNPFYGPAKRDSDSITQNRRDSPNPWLSQKRPRHSITESDYFTLGVTPLSYKPRPPSTPAPVLPPPPPYKPGLTVDDIIAAAVAKKAEEDAAAAEAAAAAKLVPSGKEHKRKHRSSKKAQTPEEKEANKEKRLLKLVGAVVVKCMSKYGKSLERETFKKHAKELTQLIADKEKKSASYRDNKLEALSDEKVAKIKKFAKEYIAKVVRKMEKSGHKKRPPPSPSAGQSSSALDTPDSIEGVDVVMTEMTVEEAMDMDPASESEDEDNGDVEMEIDEDSATGGDPAAPEPDAQDGFDASDAADPRRRPPLASDDQSCAWDPHEQTDKLIGVSVVA